MFLTEIGEDKKKLVVRHPNIIDITEGSNNIASSLASRLSRNMRMFSENYGKYNYYLCKASSLHALTPANILEIINFRWRYRSLDDDSSSLKIFLAALNLCGPSTNPEDHRKYVDMQTNLSNS